MNPLQMVFKLLSALCSFYMLLIVFRVLLSWFQGSIRGKAIDMLTSVTDPYLNKFSQIQCLKIGMLDFSPIIAIAILGLGAQIFNSLAITGTVNPWGVVIYSISAIWSLISFILNILIFLMLFRVVTLSFFKHWSHPALFRIDNILYKTVAKILGVFTKNNVKYLTALIISSVILIILKLGLTIGLHYLFLFLSRL